MKRRGDPERPERARRRKLLADFVSGMVLSVQVSERDEGSADEVPSTSADPERRWPALTASESREPCKRPAQFAFRLAGSPENLKHEGVRGHAPN